jgi:hypothetical protein
MGMLLVALHGEEAHLDALYFWTSVLIAALPVAVFVFVAVKATRAYFHRREADGGGEPPVKHPG